jgi:hypothetical protein
MGSIPEGSSVSQESKVSSKHALSACNRKASSADLIRDTLLRNSMVDVAIFVSCVLVSGTILRQWPDRLSDGIRIGHVDGVDSLVVGGSANLHGAANNLMMKTSSKGSWSWYAGINMFAAVTVGLAR